MNMAEATGDLTREDLQGLLPEQVYEYLEEVWGFEWNPYQQIWSID